MTYNGSNFSTAGKGKARCSFEPINRENKVGSDSARTLTLMEIHVFGFFIIKQNSFVEMFNKMLINHD